MQRSITRPLDEVTSAYAIIAGCDLNGLGVLRALGLAQVPTVALDTDLSKATLKSRFGKKLAVRALSGELFIEDLIALRSRFEKTPVLFLTQELSVSTVSEFRARLKHLYHFTMPEHSSIVALMNKQSVQVLAEQMGFRIARSVNLTEEGGMERIRTLRFPCVLKPTMKSKRYDDHYAKAYKLETEKSLGDLWSQMSHVAHQAIVQEWIEGDDSEVFFCLQYRHRARPSFSFVGRKVCQWPIGTGGTATCIPAPDVAKELVATTDAFFSGLGFSGICSMEFKRDPRDGQFYVIEPTVGRTDYQEEIAAINGVNIPLALYRAELGQPFPTVKNVRPPRGWCDPFGYAKARAAGSSDLAKTILPGVKMYDAYFRLYDPMPYLSLIGEAVKRRLSRMVGSPT